MKIFQLFPKRTKRARQTRHPHGVDATPSWTRFGSATGDLASRIATKGRDVALYYSGSHPDEVARLPRGEIRSMKAEGAILMCSITLIAAVYVTAMWFAGVPLWAAIPVTLLVAFMISLLDRTLLANFNGQDGEALAERAGVRGYYPVSRARRWILLGCRIGFSVATFAAITIVFRTVLFDADIRSHIERASHAQNAKVRVQAEALIDRQITDAQAAFAQAVTERNELRGLISKTDQPANIGSIEAEIATERQAILDARAQFRQLVIDFQTHKRAAAAEQAGVQDKSTDSGVAGKGSRFGYHTQQMASIRVQAESIRGSVERSQNRIRELEGQRGAVETSHNQQSEQGRVALNPRLVDAERKVATADAQRTALVAKRSASVDRMEKSDPAYTAPSNGLLARVEALEAVQSRSWAAWLLSTALTAMFCILELCALLLRILGGAPHPVGAEKLNLNIRAVAEILNAKTQRRRSSRSDAANDIWVTTNDNNERPDATDAA